MILDDEIIHLCGVTWYFKVHHKPNLRAETRKRLHPDFSDKRIVEEIKAPFLDNKCESMLAYKIYNGGLKSAAPFRCPQYFDFLLPRVQTQVEISQPVNFMMSITYLM